MIRFLQRFIDAAYAKGYQRGLDDGLEESARRRAAALEQVWAIIDDNAGAGEEHGPASTGRQTGRQFRGQSSATCFDPAPAPSNVVAIHLRRADGKWHL